MTEAEWLTSTNPMPMLEFLKGKATGRKCRLFAVACCFTVEELLTQESRVALETAERFADGHASETDRRLARASALAAGWVMEGPVQHARGRAKASVSDALARRAIDAAIQTARRSGGAAAQFAANRLALAAAGNSAEHWTPERRSSLEASVHLTQARSVRDIFGNPFRGIVVEPANLVATVVALAQMIYDDRHFDRMPVLADALEQAGCTNSDVLDHCRGPGPHVRGCWAVDMILGKE